MIQTSEECMADVHIKCEDDDCDCRCHVWEVPMPEPVAA